MKIELWFDGDLSGSNSGEWCDTCIHCKVCRRYFEMALRARKVEGRTDLCINCEDFKKEKENDQV